ncbi:MAG: J domain-containing protein [Hyphococcus sp.]
MFDKTTGAYRDKKTTPATLRLTGAAPEDVELFHVPGERLTDLLNDPRAFLPVRRASGEIMIVAKHQIASVAFLDGEQSARAPSVAKSGGALDPYDVLRISPDASSKDLRAAFRARIKAVHPDTVAALGLDEDLSKAASQATQRIIHAYRKIMRERGANDAAADQETCPAS